MLAWWMLLPTLLAMMVALVLPGFMWLRAGGRSSLVAIGAAPAFTFGLITILSVAYPALDIEWEPSTALPILGMSALGGAGAWSLSFFRRSNDGFSLRGVPLREAIGVRKPIGGGRDPRGHVGSDPGGLRPRGVAPRDGRGPIEPCPAVGSDVPSEWRACDAVRQERQSLRWPPRAVRRP